MYVLFGCLVCFEGVDYVKGRLVSKGNPWFVLVDLILACADLAGIILA
jgi:hypothetical protein